MSGMKEVAEITRAQLPSTIEEIRAQAQELIVGGQPNSIIQIRQGYLTAVVPQVKRDMVSVREQCLEQAIKYPEGMFYEWVVMKKIQTTEGEKRIPQVIKGPSVRVAETIMQYYGNCSADVFPVAITPEHIIFSATFIDLERGTNFSRAYIMNRGTLKLSAKQQMGGDEEAFRQEEIRVQAVTSRIWRNVIFAGTPRALREEMQAIAEKQCAEVLTGKDLQDKLKNLGGELYRLHNLRTNDLERYLDCEQSKWRGRQAVQLIGLVQALKENPEALMTVFPHTIAATDYAQFQEPPKAQALSPDQDEALRKDIPKYLKLLESNPDNYREWISKATNGQAIGSVDLKAKPELIIECARALFNMCREQNLL